MGAIGSPNKYVNPDATGGTYDGTTKATAWKSIKDITGLSAGDCIMCKSDASVDTLTSGFVSGTAGTGGNKNVIYSGNWTTDALEPGYQIDANSAVADAISGSISYWDFVGLKISNCTNTPINSGGSDNVNVNFCVTANNGGNDIELDNTCSITDHTSLNSGGDGISLDATALVQNCYIFNPTGRGILSQYGSFTNNVIDGTGEEAISATSILSTYVLGNTIYSCAAGVSIASATGGVVANVFSSVTGTALEVGANGQVYEDFNVYYNNGTNRSATGFLCQVGNSVDTAVNPLTDPANKDYSRVAGTSIIGVSRKPGADWDTTIQSVAYVTAGLAPEYGSGGGGVANRGILTGGRM